MTETQAERIARNVIGEYHYLCSEIPRAVVMTHLKENTDIFCSVLAAACPLSDEVVRELILIEFGRCLGSSYSQVGLPRSMTIASKEDANDV